MSLVATVSLDVDGALAVGWRLNWVKPTHVKGREEHSALIAVALRNKVDGMTCALARAVVETGTKY
jgi:hypothetical protein